MFELTIDIAESFAFSPFFSTALLGTPLVIYNINLQYNTKKKKKEKKRKEAKTQKG